ncbi:MULTISPECIES: rod shape-determining protein MreD [Clostridium]|uniref:Rod shape-determining protein MreD n=1 Tax=Clostridium senegalense TaxID=1465809 RepID=A0A6M0H0H0_9CLOT|nr:MULTISPECIES: rod shape-determining protein MreD [Clostridium]NEU03371.1 rod shape-determining protein MreD [Clostridium senegalense]
MKKILTLIGIILVLTILDNTLVTFFAIKSVYPSLVLIFIISYSIINGEKEAILLGIFSGAIQDLYFFNGIGVNMLTNMIICYIAAVVGKSIFKEKSFVPIVSTLFLSILKGIIILIVLYLMNIKINTENILYTSLYNMVLSIILYRYVYKLSETKFIKKEWRF